MRDARGDGRPCGTRWRCRSRPTSRWPRPPTCAPRRRCGACDIVNVKLAPSGGFSAARDALREAARARPRRVPVEHARRAVGHRRGAAAGRRRARAARLRAGDARAVRRRRSRSRLPPPADGLLVVPQGPGLGLAIDDAAHRRGARRGTRPVGPRTRRGASSCGAWPASGISRTRASRSSLRHPPRGAGVAAVLLAGGEQHRAAQVLASRCQTGSSAPWPALRRSWASRRGSWLSRPGRCHSRSSSGWVSNTGWRSQRSTTSSIERRSIHSASDSSERRRSSRSPRSSMPGAHPHQHERPEPVRLAQRGVQRQAAAHRVAHQRVARLGRLDDLRRPAPRRSTWRNPGRCSDSVPAAPPPPAATPPPAA